MKRIFYCFLFTIQLVGAQKLKKADKAVIADIQTHINYLASDALEGRRTGSKGEKLAYEYISNEFLKEGLMPKGDNGTYLQEFEINEGKMVSKDSYLFINGAALAGEKEYFPLSFCNNASVASVASIALQENGNAWFYDIKELLEANQNNPHFDLANAIKLKAASAAKKRQSHSSFIILRLLMMNCNSIQKTSRKFLPFLLSTLPKMAKRNI